MELKPHSVTYWYVHLEDQLLSALTVALTELNPLIRDLSLLCGWSAFQTIKF